jgi:predicted CoA-substrate-specific enzyme activase
MSNIEGMRIGIDIGSISVKFVVLNDEGIVKKGEISHKGEIGKGILNLKKEIEEFKVDSIGITSSFGGKNFGSIEPVHPVKALIKGAKFLLPDVRNIIDAGGSSATLIILNENGELSRFRTNSQCAAGTGAFLEHQANRLEISPEEMGKRAFNSCPPSIATRCAVFAKTDIIHRQQEGDSVDELWHGLCKGVAETLLSTLLKGIELSGKTLLTGGLSRNPLFVRYLNEKIKELFISELSPFASAIGASFFGSEKNFDFLRGEIIEEENEKRKRRVALLIKNSSIKEHKNQISFTDENGTEVAILKEGYGGKVWLGIDIGSTSTKLCAVSEDKEVVFHLYRKTKGDPISATRFLFYAKKEVERHLKKIDIAGIGTTGSGRRMIGKILRADLILNEITAHTEGAKFQCDGVETIFEIGGQDSKYMHLKNGIPDQINMNYVCAAGTGSFIEELAELLGFRVQDVGEMVSGVEPPYTSERCTVFMEQDALALLKKGFTKREVMAGVIYSVAFNYLSRVVEKRPITGDFVLFQGATARNKGLIAAFETILSKRIYTTDLCHINGALGVALECMRRCEIRRDGEPDRFLFGEIQQRSEECSICSNHCKITYIKSGNEETSWGYMCGREPEEVKKRELKFYRAFEERNKLLSNFIKQTGNFKDEMGLPLSLSTHLLMPFYVKFLNELGYKVLFSGETTDDVIKKGDLVSTSDFCLPVKACIGHLVRLTERGIKKVFLPYTIRHFPRKKFSNTHFCPYCQGMAGLFNSIKREKGLNVEVLSPILDFGVPERINVNKFFEVFSKEGFSHSEVKRAYRNAVEHYKEFLKECEELGKRLVEEMKNDSVPTICIVGRNYTIYDKRLSLRLPFLFATYGVNVIPAELMKFSEEEFPEGFENMFWWNGQNMINATIQALKNGFYPVVISNFSCGPDSFIIGYIEMLCEKEPHLILEIDEHSSETGFLTRIEAFVDVITRRKISGGTKFYIKRESEIEKRKILIPNMHPVGNHFFAAVFRKYGYDAETLPPERRSGFEIGRKFTRGSECLPMAVTLGNLLEFINERGYEPHKLALFMPTSDGPCRFGQYATMQKAILERAGLSGMSIITPSAANAYLGLPNSMRKDLWKAILAGDIVFKMRCKLKPRDKGGNVEKLIEDCIRKGIDVFERDADLHHFLEYLSSEFKKIALDMNKKVPLVGVVGEIFVRCNPFSNDYLLQSIEKYGGEMWLAPISEWIFFTSFNHVWKSREKRDYIEVLKNKLKNRFLKKIEEEAYELVEDFLWDRREPEIHEMVESAIKFLPKEHTTEAFITIGRAIKFIERDKCSLIVNASPFTCMPGNIASSIFLEIERKFGVPVISIFYDGEEGLNEKIGIYLKG